MIQKTEVIMLGIQKLLENMGEQINMLSIRHIKDSKLE